MSQADTLLTALTSTDMLEIDGLYAWHFELHGDHPEHLLSIEVMDGSTRREWRFTRATVETARYEAASDTWILTVGDASHRIKCLDALVASSDEVDVEDDGGL
ncbi:DUF5629 family protein [Zestomonas carbonaria]|uniref:DUF5629 domain-containing protein n=1 Tax=Zestomonas carbonaria TaxID=2762745 RepID=A0A7U7I8L8_9GAMM|nr:DUF5629 family protein [Pseudomonas carbonaria]CAD5107276.1 hypothetical protein PSEWESI4_01547 [Pseudomonas carbonaria]